MTKRSWTEANGDGTSPAGPSPSQLANLAESQTQPPLQHGPVHGFHDGSGNVAAGLIRNDMSSLQNVPAISRKVKACAACRKQKVRCLMDERGPPCRRCAEKDLSCVLNKSLQTLINERLPQTDALIQDLEMVSSSVQQILKTLNLPDMGPLQSSRLPAAHTPVSAEQNEGIFVSEMGPSCDNSPKLSPEDERDLPRLPIQSVYHLTKLSAFRSPEGLEQGTSDQPASRGAPSDFISQGLLPLEDAERLFHLYTNRLDHYMYGVGARYKSLAVLRQKSSILTAAVLTVAAMHDAQSNNIYLICNREFRRLFTGSLFERCVDRDYLRALCIASYWLNDASWMLAGVASRQAATFNIASHFRRLSEENSEDAADFVRIWYLIYICDQHLSTLYGRQCETREDFAVMRWETLVQASTATVGDQRLASQVALLTIIHKIRELFGPDPDKPIPVVFLTQINGFSRQLDQWVGRWTTTFPEYQQDFGTFPRKGALFHFQFAKLYLFSHVFRGLRDSAVPSAFLEAANGATSAAVSILNMIISEPDVRAALVGLPCYVQSMIGFACMFLAKLTSIHGDEMIDRNIVTDLFSRLIVVCRTTPVGKWHLIHHMADGLERILKMLQQPPNIPRQQEMPNGEIAPDQGGGMFNFGEMGQWDSAMVNFDPYFLMDTGMGMGVPGQVYFGREDLELNTCNVP